MVVLFLILLSQKGKLFLSVDVIFKDAFDIHDLLVTLFILLLIVIKLFFLFLLGFLELLLQGDLSLAATLFQKINFSLQFFLLLFL